ncbi:5-bromo-4-chloroindolyl phosphate hydrolysis family protein [Acidobacteriota bacterium]
MEKKQRSYGAAIEKKEKKLGFFGHLLALIIGGACFSLLYYLVKFSLLLSIIIGIVVYFLSAGQLFFLKINKGDEIKLSEIKDKKLKKVLKEGQKKLRDMKTLSKKIPDYKIRNKVTWVHSSAVDIYENFKTDPRDIRKARTFLNYHLDAANTILTKYVQLKNRKTETPELKEILINVETLLDTIKESFDRQLTKLLENDVMDLDVEIEVLKKTLQAEGLV